MLCAGMHINIYPTETSQYLNKETHELFKIYFCKN